MKQNISTGLVICCPKCGSEKVRYVPAKKPSLGAGFYIWLVLSLFGFQFSIIISIVMFVLWVVVLILRLLSSIYEKKYSTYRCDMCGHEFEIPKKP